MSRKCDITGKRGLNIYKVSHAHNRSKKVQQPNLKKRRIFVPELKRYVSVKVSTHGLKILDKQGAYVALKAAGLI